MSLTLETKLIKQDHRNHIEFVLSDGDDHWSTDFCVDDLPTDERREWLRQVLEKIMKTMIERAEVKTKVQVYKRAKEFMEFIGLR